MKEIFLNIRNRNLLSGMFLLSSFYLQSQEIIHEGFNNGLTAPDGWTIKAGGIYTSLSGSGDSAPSIKFTSTGDFIETCNFSGASECSFWIKGYSTDNYSALVISYQIGETWTKLDSIINIPHAEKIIVLPLPENSRKLYFKYYKSKGNLAFDDLIVRKASISNDTLCPVFTYGNPKYINTSDSSALFKISISKPGIIYYFITTEICPIPSTEDFFNPAQFQGSCAISFEKFQLNKNLDTNFLIKNLSSQINYVVYWLISSLDNKVADSGSFIKISFCTNNIENNLFFSEIIKGSSKNKAIEIFNPSKDTVYLTNYRIEMSTNGAGWKSNFVFPVNSKISPYDVYVILKTGADSNIVNPEIADDITGSSVVSFTGNDARGLQKNDENGTWKLVDIFGYPDSLIVFDIAGVKEAAGSHTIRRKPSVRHGNTNWANSAGTNSEDSEWIVLGSDDFSDLGKHEIISDKLISFDSIFMNDQESIPLIDSIDKSITFTLHSDADISNMKIHYLLPPGVSVLPDSSSIFDFSKPVKLKLTTIGTIFTTEWTIYTTVDAAPRIIDLHYDNKSNPGEIILDFNEPIDNINPNSSLFVKNQIKLIENSAPEIQIPFDVSSNDSNREIKVLPETPLNSSSNYTIYIDSICDVNNNFMPSYEWTFTLPTTNLIDENQDYRDEIKVWPNPTTDYLIIKVPPEFFGSSLSIEIISIEGRIIYPRILERNEQIKLSLPNVVNNIYILKISTNKNTISKLINIIRK